MEAISTAAGESLPCVLVACKDDLGMAPALEEEVVAACADLALPLPVPVAAEAGEAAGALRRLVSVAIQGGNAPFTAARKVGLPCIIRYRMFCHTYSLSFRHTSSL